MYGVTNPTIAVPAQATHGADDAIHRGPLRRIGRQAREEVAILLAVAYDVRGALSRTISVRWHRT